MKKSVKIFIKTIPIIIILEILLVHLSIGYIKNQYSPEYWSQTERAFQVFVTIFFIAITCIPVYWTLEEYYDK